MHEDLSARFKSLKGQKRQQGGGPIASTGGDADDDKTLEDLLADLGPASQWQVDRSEADQIDDLLRSATNTLRETCSGQDESVDDISGAARLPTVDVSVFRPESTSTDPIANEDHVKPLPLDEEADEVLRRIMDEVRHETSHPTDDTSEQDEADDNHQTTSHNVLPSTPSNNLDPSSDPPPPYSPSTMKGQPQTTSTPDPDPDTLLAARFASLSLPSALPSTPSTLPSAPTTLPTKPHSTYTTRTNPRTQPTDSEISTWCCICLLPASLRCLGCSLEPDGERDDDGSDLYCTDCWLEGHRGPDAGYEEKGHRAVMFSKDGGKKKGREVGQRRVRVGA